MFKKLLIALEDSAWGSEVGRYGLDLAHRLGARALALHVLSPHWLPDVDALERGAGPCTGVRVLDGLQDGVVPLERRVVLEDRIERAILDTAQSQGADLIVLGTQGRAGLDRLLEGSVAEGVLRHSAVPVLVLRQGIHPGAPTSRLSVATDGGPSSEGAVTVAAGLSRRLGMDLDLLHVEEGVSTVRDHEEHAAQGNREIEEVLRQRGEYVLALGRTLVLQTVGSTAACTTRVLEGQGERVAAVLCRDARQTAPGLLVLGTHGRSGLRRLLEGSVAEGVLRHAPCPVLIVPGQARAKERTAGVMHSTAPLLETR